MSEVGRGPMGRYLMKYVRYDWQTNSMARPYAAARARGRIVRAALTHR